MQILIRNIWIFSGSLRQNTGLKLQTVSARWWEIYCLKNLRVCIRWTDLLLSRKKKKIVNTKPLFPSTGEFIKNKHNALQGNSWGILSLGSGGRGRTATRKTAEERWHFWGAHWKDEESARQVEEMGQAFGTNRDKANGTCSETFLGLSHPQRLNKDE